MGINFLNQSKLVSNLKLAVFIVAFCFSLKANSQCCSAGSPVGVGTYAGLVAKSNLRITTFGRYTHSADYFSGDSRLENPLLVRQSNFVYQGLNLSYGIIKGLAAEIDIGYFYLKDQTLINDYYMKGYGLSNGTFMLKAGIFKSDSARLEISGGIGLKFPFSAKSLYIDNVRLPIDLQPSTHAFGVAGQLFLRKVLIPYRMSLYFINRYEYNFKNADEYRFGDRFRSSLVLEGNISRKFGAMFQARFEYGGYDYDFNQNKRFEHSGSIIVFASPLILYSIAQTWHLSLSADFPVYKYYNGAQLGNKYSIALNLTKDFSLSKKK